MQFLVCLTCAISSWSCNNNANKKLAVSPDGQCTGSDSKAQSWAWTPHTVLKQYVGATCRLNSYGVVTLCGGDMPAQRSTQGNWYCRAETVPWQLGVSQLWSDEEHQQWHWRHGTSMVLETKPRNANCICQCSMKGLDSFSLMFAVHSTQTSVCPQKTVWYAHNWSAGMLARVCATLMQAAKGSQLPWLWQSRPSGARHCVHFTTSFCSQMHCA